MNNDPQQVQTVADGPPVPDDVPVPADTLVEVDMSRVVRPEQIIVPEVTGLSVPVMTQTEDGPKAKWLVYLRWPDGQRERRELDDQIELPGGGCLWVRPVPTSNAIVPELLAGWSAESRRRWLKGEHVPDPLDVFNRLCRCIDYYVDFPKEMAGGAVKTLALWTIFTHVSQAWDAAPYLHVGGLKASGKTTVFNVLARLVFRPLQTSNPSPSVLFRTLHNQGGTLLYDEAEQLRQNGPNTPQIMADLLAGYKRGSRVMRNERCGDSFIPVYFDIYGPKALACIENFSDTLMSRCIRVVMMRAAEDSPKPRRRISEHTKPLQALRDDLHALMLENGPTWLKLAKERVDCPGISGRTHELWQPLLALAGWIESRGATGLLDTIRHHAQATIADMKDDVVPYVDEVLLKILAESVVSGERVTPDDILGQARMRDPATFDKSWDAQRVGYRLREYGFRTKSSNGQRLYRCITLHDMLAIQQRYGVNLGLTDPAISPEKPTLADTPDTPPEGGCEDGQS